jgi:hypothetical protein
VCTPCIPCSLHGPLIVVSRMATAQHICLTEAEVLSAVDSTDVGVMMGPSLVAISFTLLALLGPVSYLSKHYKSRIPLLDVSRCIACSYSLFTPRLDLARSRKPP